MPYSYLLLFLFQTPCPPLRSPLFPYTTLFRSAVRGQPHNFVLVAKFQEAKILCHRAVKQSQRMRKSYRSEEHTSELQSQTKLVCRLLLEKKNNLKHMLMRKLTLT